MDKGREPSYWVQVFSVATWQRFLDVGSGVTGFRDRRWKHIQTMQKGDFVLCYLSGLSKWVGVLEILATPYLDLTPIWDEELFPCRAEVKLVSALPVDHAVPIRDLREQLSIFKVKNWSLYLVISPSKWKTTDGEAVVAAINEAQKMKKKTR